MQTWIKANIGKLIGRITKAENAIGMPYNAPLNLSTRVYNLEMSDHSPDIYALGLQQVGKWIDGKTIYKKTTHPGDLPANSTTLYTHGGGRTIDKLIKAEAIYSYVDSAYNMQFVGNVGNSRKLVQIYLNKKSGDIVAEFDNTYPYKDVYITYWYTLEEVNK